MHGSGNPIYLAETYGYTNISAREELIVIIPEDETDERNTAAPIDGAAVFLWNFRKSVSFNI